MDNLKFEINEQISKINRSFTNSWGGLYFNSVENNDIVILEKILKKVTIIFKIYNAVSIIFSTVLIIFSMMKYFNIVEFGNMNKSGLMILFTIVLLMNAFKYYKVKVNLENKIYLLGLLTKIDKE